MHTTWYDIIKFLLKLGNLFICFLLLVSSAGQCIDFVLLTSPEMSPQGASSVPLVEADVHALISMSRSSRVLSLSANAAESDMSTLMEEFPFVPLLILAILASIILDARRLRRLLHQDWVRSWNGWRNANCLLDDSADDATSETIASDIIQDFSRISLQNVDIVAKTDAVRRREVEAEGRHIGV